MDVYNSREETALRRDRKEASRGIKSTVLDVGMEDIMLEDVRKNATRGRGYTKG